MRTLLTLVTLQAVFVVACGGDSSSPGSGSGGSTQSGQGGSSSGGASSTPGGAANSGGFAAGGATGTANGGTTAGGSSTANQGGTVTGGAEGKGGAAVATGGSKAASGGVAGSGGSGGNAKATGGVVGAGGASGGASSSGGTGGGAISGGSTGTGGSGNTAACTRELLKSTLDAYYKALAAHDPSSLALADNVKFTENGKAMKMGDQGLWKSAGALKYSHDALDTEVCTVASQAVVPDGAMDIPFALRIKVQSQKITEVETIAVRPGDYKVSGQDFPSNTAALIASATSVNWQDVVPAADRNTRAEITGWMDKYYRLFPRGVCNTTSACKRIENGGGSFSCSSGASCDAGTGTGQPALPSRLILADVETGIGVGFTMFQGNTDMHMFKMYADQVHGVSAILGAAGSSGWD